MAKIIVEIITVERRVKYGMLTFSSSKFVSLKFCFFPVFPLVEFKSLQTAKKPRFQICNDQKGWTSDCLNFILFFIYFSIIDRLVQILLTLLN